jgi:hypothetical protein
LMLMYEIWMYMLDFQIPTQCIIKNFSKKNPLRPHTKIEK